MNRLPPVCCVGVRGEGPPLLGVCAPGQEWGPCLEGTHPGVAISPDFSDCHSALSWGNEASTKLGTLLGRGAHSSWWVGAHGISGHAPRALPAESQRRGLLVVLWAQGGVRGAFLGEML